MSDKFNLVNTKGTLQLYIHLNCLVAAPRL